MVNVFLIYHKLYNQRGILDPGTLSGGDFGIALDKLNWPFLIYVMSDVSNQMGYLKVCIIDQTIIRLLKTKDLECLAR